MKKVNQPKVQWVVAIGAAFAWFGNHCGAGFCSGLTLLKYFTRAGWLSLVTTIIPFIILGFVFYYMGEYSRLIRADSYKDVAFSLYSKKEAVGKVMVVVFDVIVLVSLLVNSSTVLAGAGTFLNQALGMNYFLGTLLCLLIVVAISMFGATIMAKIDLPLGVIMTSCILIVAAILLKENWSGVTHIVQTKETFNVSTGSAIGDMLWYTGIQVGFCSAYIAIAGKFTSKNDNKVMAIFGGFLNGFMLFVVSLAVLSRMPGISTSVIPIYDMIVERFGSTGILSVIYSVGLFLAYVSMSDVVAVCARFGPWFNPRKKYNQAVVDMIFGTVLLGVSLLLAQLGVVALVTKGYQLISFLRIPTFIVGGLVFAPWRIHQINKQRAASLTESAESESALK
jgi:uncharacterized membrane protein YkvI